MRMRLWVVVGVVLLGVLAAVGEVRAKHIGLNDKGDFKELSRRGFWETINNGGTYTQNNTPDATGSALIPPADGSATYLNRQRNSYTWGSGWFNGNYYVGTVRDVGCFLINPDDPLCPADANGDGSPEPGADQRAEIWRYAPAGTGGATGSWIRVLQSPCIVAGGGFALSACQGFPTFGVAANLPRDIGYRGMTVSTNTVGDPADLPLDASARLWVATFGLGGRVLHSTNGTTFTVGSLNGLATIPSITSITGLTALQNIATVDLGYRSIVIWRGRVCIAPAGSYADEDLPVNPTVLCNSNPASTTSNWQTIVNVKTHPTLGSDVHPEDGPNIGMFSIGVFNGDLYIGVSNRTTGVQIWRLPASECPIPVNSSTLCNANSPNWQRVIIHGGGRPIPSDGLPDSAFASAMQVHNGGGGDALYIGTSDAAVFQNSRAEMFRINGDGTWDLIVGSPRQKSVMDAMNADPALAANFNCLTTVLGNRTKFDFDGNGPNPAVHACFPLGNMAAGFGSGASTTTGSPPVALPVPVAGGYSSGPFGYVWRMAVHNDGSTDPSTVGNFLYVGTLHTGGGNFGGSQNNPSGYDLLKSKDGVTWNTAANTVVNEGMGNSNNYGVRTLVSVPGGAGGWPGGGPALLVGSANPSTEEADEPNNINTGGAEVHLGTCTPTSTATAVASVVTQDRATSPTYKNQVIFDATNNQYVAFDDDAVPNNSVDVTLVGSASNSTFCGDLTAYAWYPIPAIGGIAGSVLASGALTPPAAVPNLPQTLATGADYTPYFYRLCVNGASAAPGCADVAVTASHNLRPTAAITPAPPTIPGGGLCGGNNSRVCLVDMDGDTFETFTVQGTCTDPETLVPTGSFFSTPPASCVWSADTGIAFTPSGSVGAAGGPDDDPDSAGTAYTVRVPVSTGGGGGGGTSSVYLTATDDHGYTNQARTRVRVIAPVHDVQVTTIAFSPALTGGYAAVDTTYTVNVTVRNNGTYDETFNVTLTDSTGSATVNEPLSASPGKCMTGPPYVGLAPCPTTELAFTWTPTAASVHTLTATAATVTGETSTTNNAASTLVQVGHSLTILGSPSSNANPVASGGTANLSVDAVDSDTTHVLAYSWAADCPPALVTDGTFGTSTAASTTWVAPANTTPSQQNCAISVNVNDGGVLSTTPSYTQVVNPAHTLTISPTSSVPSVASGGTTVLAANANDSFGHTRFYSWQVVPLSCTGGIGSGSFSAPTSAGTNWTASANLTGSAQTCTIRVTVNDGAVPDPKSAFAEITQTVNALAHTLTINSGPTSSADPVASGGTANLSVTATDSYGHSLSYSWSASCPTLPSNGTFGPNSASTTWTAPANTTPSVQSCTISVNVTADAGGLSQTPSYSQEVNVACSGAVCAPTNVTAAVLTTTPRVFKVSWTDVAVNETSYQVQRCRLSFGFCSYSTVTGSPFAANTNTINNTVSSAGTYRFRVRACNASGCSAYVTSNNIAIQ